MVLAADGCFSIEFIALWIRTHGQRVQTETRAVKSDREPPWGRNFLVVPCARRRHSFKRKGVREMLEQILCPPQGWDLGDLGQFPPSRKWLCNELHFFQGLNKFIKSRLQA